MLLSCHWARTPHSTNVGQIHLICHSNSFCNSYKKLKSRPHLPHLTSVPTSPERISTKLYAYAMIFCFFHGFIPTLLLSQDLWCFALSQHCLLQFPLPETCGRVYLHLQAHSSGNTNNHQFSRILIHSTGNDIPCSCQWSPPVMCQFKHTRMWWLWQNLPCWTFLGNLWLWWVQSKNPSCCM